MAGLTAVLASEPTREAIWDALWHRRVVATTGPRILVRFEIDGHPMGSELNRREHPSLQGRRTIRVDVHGTTDIARIDIIRSNRTVHSVTCSNGPDHHVLWQDTDLLDTAWLPQAKYCNHPFCFYYVRVVQTDGEAAWASPVWIDPE